MMPAVGKSGAGISLITSSMAQCGWASTCKQASTTSPRLCGGMLVALSPPQPQGPVDSTVGNPGRAHRGEGHPHLPPQPREFCNAHAVHQLTLYILDPGPVEI